MYNKKLIGKNIDEATAELTAAGVTEITVVRNDTKGDYRTDVDLVVKADVSGKSATLTVSKFLLKV